MRHASATACAIISTLAPLVSLANECWTIANVKGYSAFSDQNYGFSQDGFKRPMLICFTEASGTVTGTDIQLVRFGDSTLAGYGSNARGSELFEVYQIDRVKRKLLYVKTRIGSSTLAAMLPDVVASYVGDATMVDQ